MKQNIHLVSLTEKSALRRRIWHSRPVQIVTLLCLVLCMKAPGKAMTVLTNCTDPLVPVSIPKQVMNGCPELDRPFFGATPRWQLMDSTVGGFFAIFRDMPSSQNSSQPPEAPKYAGIARANDGGAFLWSLAANDAAVFPSEHDSSIFAVAQNRDRDGEMTLVFGWYRDGGDTPVPIVERELPFCDYQQVRVAHLRNGGVVVSLDLTSSVSLLGLNASGDLAWARELRGPELPVSSNGNEPPHFTDLQPMGASDALLHVSAPVRQDGQSKSESLLVRVANDGALRWIKKVRLPVGATMPMANPMAVASSGEIGLLIFDPNFPGISTTIVNLDQNGEMRWAKRVDRTMFFGAQFLDDSGNLLLNGFRLPTVSPETVFAILESNGDVVAVAAPQLPSASGPVLTFPVGVSRDDGRIYYSGMPGPIGSSSLVLDDFRWRNADPASNAFSSTATQFLNALQPLNDGRLVCFTHQPGKSAPVIATFLDSGLESTSDCDLFKDFSVSVLDLTLSVDSAEPEIGIPALDASDLNLELAFGDVVFQQAPFTEESLCEAECGFTLSSTEASFEAAGGSVSVQIGIHLSETEPGQCHWTVQDAPEWLTVAPAAGDGAGQVTITATVNPGRRERSATMTVAGLTLAVSQAADDSTPNPSEGVRWLASGGAGGGLIEWLIESGSAEVIIPNMTFWSLDVSPDKKLYAIGGRADELYEIDPVTRAVRRLELVSGPRLSRSKLAVSPDGMLYIVAADNHLYRMDLDTGEAVQTGRMPSGTRAIDFSPDGRLFAVDSTVLVEINPNTAEVISTIGSLTYESPSGQAPLNVTDIDFASDGSIYAVGSGFIGSTLYRIDAATAETEPVAVLPAQRLGALASGAWTDEPLAPPSMAASMTGGELILSWPAFAGDLMLEFSTDLISWRPYRVTSPPTLNDEGQLTLAVPLPQTGGDAGGGGRDPTTPQVTRTFFRLRSR